MLFGFAINSDPKGLPAALVAPTEDRFTRAIVSALGLQAGQQVRAFELERARAQLLSPSQKQARGAEFEDEPESDVASAWSDPQKIIDFVRMLAGPLAPPRAGLLEMYLSDAMFWRAWPDHVEGWWRLAAERHGRRRRDGCR